MPVTKVLIPAVENGALKLNASGAQVYREVYLGRRPPRPGKAALALSKYLKGTPTPPASVDWFTKAAAALQRMYLNDTYGCCVIASKYHQVGVHTGNESGTPVQGTDQEVYQEYQSICGPGDNGCVITDVLDAMKARGLPCNGVLHTIDGYVAVDWTNKLEVQCALDIFGALCIGINLPSAWADGASPGGTWDVTNTGVVGGHDVCCVGYNATGVQISTWGMVPPITITWSAFTSKNWIEECWAMLSPDWYSSAKLAPNGLDSATLAADLATLGGGNIPDPTPAPPVPPSPPTPPPPPGPVPVPPAPPTPPVPPVPPVNFPNYTLSLAGQMPGLFGQMVPVTFTGTASPAASGGGAGAIPWTQILALLAQYGAKVLPVILADIAAQKTLAQIIADCLAVLFPPARKGPCAGCR